MSDIITSGSVAIKRLLNDSDHAECGNLKDRDNIPTRSWYIMVWVRIVTEVSPMANS